MYWARLLFLTLLILLAFVTFANASVDGLSGASGLTLIFLLLFSPLLVCWIFVKIVAIFVKPERKRIVTVSMGYTLLLALFARIIFGYFVSPFGEHHISFLHWMIGSFILASVVGVWVAIWRSAD